MGSSHLVRTEARAERRTGVAAVTFIVLPRFLAHHRTSYRKNETKAAAKKTKLKRISRPTSQTASLRDWPSARSRS